MDRHLTLKDHITNTVNTCNGYLGVLRRLINYLPKRLCTLFYTAIIRSHLEYASCLLHPVAKSHLDKLDTIQRKAARIICEVPSDSHADPLLQSLGLQSLHDRRIGHILKVVAKALDEDSHPSLINMFSWDTDSDELCLKVPTTNTLVGKKRLSVYGAETYNNFLSG